VVIEITKLFRAWFGTGGEGNSPSPVRNKTAHTVFGASVFFDAPLPWGCNGARSESPCQMLLYYSKHLAQCTNGGSMENGRPSNPIGSMLRFCTGSVDPL